VSAAASELAPTRMIAQWHYAIVASTLKVTLLMMQCGTSGVAIQVARKENT